jgi:UDP-hydrolysing UDP-N-acetyl-D-glucosamine 2-epimerase
MRIAIVTGSRADRNALEMVEAELVSLETKPSGLVTHKHDLSWIDVNPSLPTITRKDAALTTARQVAFVVECLAENETDLVILHADRHEILGAAVAANVMGVPIAHIGGGDITEGSQDDCFRHAITKLSHLHFATNQDAAARIIQMGEQPDRVHVTGDPGIDMVRQTPLLGRDETFAAVGLKSCDRLILVCFHPNTLGDTRAELIALENAIEDREEPVVFIGPNADAGSDMIREEWRIIAGHRKNTVFHENLQPQVFYSLMVHCDVMVGNSSAGFYEAPYFGTPVISIGDRQMGRSQPPNVVTVAADAALIGGAIDNVFILCQRTPQTLYREQCSSLYGDGHAASRIAAVIDKITDPKALLRKRFYTVPEAL